MRRFFGKGSEGGQAILIMAMGMVVLVGVAGLAIDSSNLYLNRRQAQNAADFAAFAAGKQLAAATRVLSAPPLSGDASVHAAHDFAAMNGFPTVYSTSCDVASGSSFTTTWFDSGGFACSATSGFRTKIQINVPVISVGGLPVPTDCTAAFQYSCFQVTLTERVGTIFGRTFGVNDFYYTVSAIVKTTPANAGGYSVPPPIGMYLYQPQTGCLPAQQCFDETKAVARAGLSCSGLNNCPTFWVNSGTAPSFWGTDGLNANPPGDYVTLQSNGDMVIQDTTIFCDPYGGAACSTNNAVGAKGFALAAGSKLYCKVFSNGGSANGLLPCTNSVQSNLQHMGGKETTPLALANWSPSVDTSALAACGALVLNGDTVANSFTIAGSPQCVDQYEPYLIMPGKYSYIVINHGTYSFEAGLYDLSGVAPVNTATGSACNGNCSGYLANGIDHSNEQAGVNKDFDLCTTGQPNGCPTLTAAVWIGHGGGSFGAYYPGTQGSGCTGGTLGTDSGGGDATIVQGSGVAFRFEATAGGFVSTHEVQGIALSGPGVGGMNEVAGTPLLFDLENSSFIHLDSTEIQNSISQFVGIIYQTQQFATGGGVEFNPALGAPGIAAIDGQIWAYSLTTFGTGGPAVDFTDGFGGAGQPLIGTSGQAENSIVTSNTLSQAVDGSGNPIAGFETLTIKYTDEWAMDAYDLYVKINNAQPTFFGKGIWNPVPPNGAPVPPVTNNPGDSNPAYPATSLPSGYTGSTNTANLTADWTYTTGAGATLNTWEVNGNWTWGHEKVIPGATRRNNLVTIKYTFPTPPGQSVAVTIFLTDGDRCGDYYLVAVTMNNVGQAYGGAQSTGSVVLVR